MNIFKHIKFKMPAFTITEAVITLAVIGILWSLSVVIFIPKVSDIVRTHQIKAAKMKFTKSMEVMAVKGKLNTKYNTTQDFVNELKNYLKIEKICDNNHLSDCFDYETIRLKDGTTLNLSDLSDGSGFPVEGNYSRDYSGPTVGIRTLDGTSMVLAWNKKCKGLKPGVYKWSDDTNKTTDCVIGLFDINGDGTPNILDKDVVYFNLLDTYECGIKFTYDGKKYCWDEPFAPTPLTNEDCAINKSKYDITNCVPADNAQYSNQDYWGGAMKTCKEQGKRLPNRDELLAFTKYLYGTDDIMTNNSPDGGMTNTLTLNEENLQKASTTLLTNFQSRNYHVVLWSDTEYSELYSQNGIFFSDKAGYGYGVRYMSTTALGICVPE